jgi:ribonuclease R
VRVGEVIERDGTRRLRLGFSGGEGVLVDPVNPGSLGEPGSFHEVLGSGAWEVGEIVAAAGTALAGVHRIAARAELASGFSDAVLAETAALVESPGIDDPELDDLTGLPFITIDYERSRDLDQALHIERRGAGYLVRYALADGAHYVVPGSALFEEATRRGASYYLPGLTLPMLPRQLSEGVVSLNPGVDRRALVFEIAIDERGLVGETTLRRARIRSRRKLTYDGVQAYLDDPASSDLAGTEIAASLDLLPAVGTLRMREAEGRDVVRYDRSAIELTLPSAGAPALAMSHDERNDVQLYNEQISLVTNIEGARLLLRKCDRDTGLAGLFRVHPGPDERDLDAFVRSVGELVDTLGLDDAWRWRRDSETLADYVARLPDGGDGHRLAMALQRQAMVMGQPSFFTTEPAPHFGIGAPAYSRFSSPMREIVGIVTLHVAYAQLDGVALQDIGLDRELVERIIAAGNRSKRTQKEITRDAHELAIDQLLSGELELEPTARPLRTGTVMGVSASKIYLQLDAPPIEIKLYLADQPVSLAPRGRFELAGDDRVIRVGDALEVRLDRYDRQRRRWILLLS